MHSETQCLAFLLDPAKPGRFILGVECDGATYHSAKTAHDRDRLRQEVLEKLGWRIYRIWAPDFVTRRDTEVQRLKDAIELARVTPDGTSLESPEKQDPPDPDPQPLLTAVKAETIQNGSWAKQYTPWTPSPNHRIPWNLEFHDPRAPRIIRTLLEQIVNSEGPLHVDVAAHRLAEAWGLHRVGSRMNEIVVSVARTLVNTSKIGRRGDFLWPNSQSFKLEVRRLNPRSTIREKHSGNTS